MICLHPQTLIRHFTIGDGLWWSVEGGVSMAQGWPLVELMMVDRLQPPLVLV